MRKIMVIDAFFLLVINYGKIFRGPTKCDSSILYQLAIIYTTGWTTAFQVSKQWYK